MTGMTMIRQRRGLMAKIATELRITRAAVSTWRSVPPDRVPEVERITGIPRHELRPDLWDAPSAPQAGAAV